MSYVVQIGEYPLCSRCLVNLNAATLLRAQLPNAGRIDHCRSPNNPGEVRKWAESILSEDGEAVFSLDAWTGAMMPVTTWQGDPICGAHLFERREAEMRLEGRRR